ncbi:MAG: lysophospholipid acyltransferase family protein [Acidimicrobiia bacterium]
MSSTAFRRRVRTIPAFTGGLIFMVALAPILLPLIGLADATRWLVRRRHWMGVRLYGFGVVYLGAEVVGLIALGCAWLAAGFGRFRRPLLTWTFAIQQAWAGTLLAAIRGIFGMRFDVTGEEVVAPGPILLLARHASIVDNLLPATLVSTPHNIRLRYVLKRELLSDPCLDVAGSRLPNYFVVRGSDDTERELQAIRELARDLGPQDGVLIYPEGTRFTKDKQARALEKLRRGDPAILERAQRLRHLLPPRLGGPLALLDATSPADVVILTHHGLDGFAHLRDIWAGGMVNTTVRVEFWRIPRSGLPTDRAGRAAWLYDVWDRIDAWIDAGKRPGPPQ